MSAVLNFDPNNSGETPARELAKTKVARTMIPLRSSVLALHSKIARLLDDPSIPIGVAAGLLRLAEHHKSAYVEHQNAVEDLMNV